MVITSSVFTVQSPCEPSKRAQAFIHLELLSTRHPISTQQNTGPPQLQLTAPEERQKPTTHLMADHSLMFSPPYLQEDPNSVRSENKTQQL